MTTSTGLDALVRRARRRIPKTTTLSYVAYDDCLSVEQIRDLLEGDEDAENKIYDCFEESREAGIEHYLEEAIPDPEERARLEASVDHYEELRDLLYDRDDSDPLKELIKHTGSRLFRYELGYTLELGYDPSAAEIARATRAMAQAAGIDSASNAKALEELAVNAHDGELCVIWYGPVREVLDLALGSRHQDRWHEVVWTTPHLLVLDAGSGAGHDVDVTGSVVRHFEPDHCHVDAKGGAAGYSWTEVCGPFEPAYACPLITRELARLDRPAPSDGPRRRRRPDPSLGL